jgi:rifampicin phosphotransferase
MISRYFVYKQALLEQAERLVHVHGSREKEDIFFLRFQPFPANASRLDAIIASR